MNKRKFIKIGLGIITTGVTANYFGLGKWLGNLGTGEAESAQNKEEVPTTVKSSEQEVVVTERDRSEFDKSFHQILLDLHLKSDLLRSFINYKSVYYNKAPSAVLHTISHYFSEENAIVNDYMRGDGEVDELEAKDLLDLIIQHYGDLVAYGILHTPDDPDLQLKRNTKKPEYQYENGDYENIEQPFEDLEAIVLETKELIGQAVYIKSRQDLFINAMRESGKSYSRDLNAAEKYARDDIAKHSKEIIDENLIF